MKTISQRELRNNSAALMDAVEAGQSFRITRNGAEVAEVRPVVGRKRPRAEELVARHRRMARVDLTRMRQEADEYFGGPDRVDEKDPWERPRA